MPRLFAVGICSGGQRPAGQHQIDRRARRLATRHRVFYPHRATMFHHHLFHDRQTQSEPVRARAEVER